MKIAEVWSPFTGDGAAAPFTATVMLQGQYPARYTRDLGAAAMPTPFGFMAVLWGGEDAVLELLDADPNYVVVWSTDWDGKPESFSNAAETV